MFVSILHDSGLGDRKTFGIYHRGKQCWSKFLLNCYLKGFWYDIIYRYTYYTPTSFSQAIHSFLLLMIQEFNELPGLVIFETVFSWNVWYSLMSSSIRRMSWAWTEWQHPWVPGACTLVRRALRRFAVTWMLLIEEIEFSKNDECNWNWCLISYTTHWVFQISLFAFIVIRVLVRSAETNIVVKIDWDRPPNLLG